MVRMYVCTYVRMYICTYVRMYVCTYVRMYVCTYVRTGYAKECQFAISLRNVNLRSTVTPRQDIGYHVHYMTTGHDDVGTTIF